MKIHSMTATFGRLEHETLALQPGLNVISAPNEWGKSTWCSFLIAMLYGMDTRAKTTKANLADKERYAPWSGSPMSGRMEISWKGRNITIERSTRGRIPLGIFRAYETDTGLPVPDLTAANCGQVLLGVEQSVFRRAGFIRFQDLPVTKDDALQHRLNALVTTGDESGDAARLEQKLRELKNKIRYNHSGLLPQAEAERQELEEKLQELESLSSRSRKLTQQALENEQLLQNLEIHRAHLACQEAAAGAARLRQAQAELQQAKEQLQLQRSRCAALPSAQEARALSDKVLALLQEISALEVRSLPAPPDLPNAKRPFRGMEPAEAEIMAARDCRSYRDAAGSGTPFFLAGIAAMLSACPLYVFLHQPLWAAVPVVTGLLLTIPGILQRRKQNARRRELAKKYGSEDPESWIADASHYAISIREYQKRQQEYRMARAEYDRQKELLRKKHAALCADASPEEILVQCRETLHSWELLEDAVQDAAQAEKQYQALASVTPRPQKPDVPDPLELSAEETASLQKQTAAQQQLLQEQIGQFRGRMEAIGSAESLRQSLIQTEARIRKLEETYRAVVLAQETLAKASDALRRRFAPRITGRAQALMAAMTEGRYDRLSFREDFSLRCSANQEDTLQDSLWRSDGTIDQLYLSLRLAVAEALTPNAPLILDDALVRFDDSRMKAAMEILKQLSAEKQIILFSCQNREAALV